MSRAAASRSGDAPLSRVLAAVAQTLESLDGCSERVARVLELTRAVVPYDQAAVLRLDVSGRRELVAWPEITGDARALLSARLEKMARLLDADADNADGDDEPPPTSTKHAAVPLVGLDELVGVLLVERRDGEEYDEDRIASLAVVGSELGAYLTLRRLVDRQAEAARELARAHEFQQLLIGMVSHDLRNPLSVITASAAVHLRKAPDEQLRRALDRIVNSAARANEIIHQLLDLTETRLGHGIPVERVEMDLDALLRGAIEDAEVAGDGRRIDYQVETGARGVGDPERLRQVFANLLGNAFRYGAPGAPVVVRLRADHGGAVVEVRNRGAAIPADLLPHLFDPFRRGPTREKGGSRGLGLGLYIVREIVTRHGGRVSCRSSEAEGTTMSVELPDFTPERASPAPPPAPPTALRVLVVDDDHDIRDALVELLIDEGYEVDSAREGAEALAKLRAGPPPDLVLLDLMMPVMDGFALIGEMRRDPALADVSVVVISAGENAFAGAGVEFLRKPLNLQALMATVRRQGALRKA